MGKRGSPGEWGVCSLQWLRLRNTPYITQQRILQLQQICHIGEKKRREEERERRREQISATNHTLHSTTKITTRPNSDVHIFYTPYRDFTGACCSNQAFDVTYLVQPLIFAINSNTTDQLKSATSSYQKKRNTPLSKPSFNEAKGNAEKRGFPTHW